MAAVLLLLLALVSGQGTAEGDSAEGIAEGDSMEGTAEGGVIVLTDSTFDSVLAEERAGLLVEFYAPWCGHCQELAPKYEEAAAMLAKAGSSVKLAKVDTTVEKALGKRFKIEGYPTLKFFQYGEPTEYSGPREAKGIVAWLEKKTGPQFHLITEKKKLDKALEEKHAIAVGFFKDLDSKASKIFQEVAGALDEISFYIVTEPSLMTELSQNDGAILLLKTFDDKEVHFKGTVTKDGLQKFIEASARPLVSEFTQENAAKIFSSEIQKHFLLLSAKADKEFESRIGIVKEVAKKYQDKMIFVHLDVGDDEHEGVLEFFGVKKDQCPTFVIFEMESSSKYLAPADQEISSDVLSTFVEDYLGGRLTKHLKTQALPADWDLHPVYTLVSSNFHSVARDRSKDVFVKFYAPWCGHCKTIAPIWEKIAEKFSDRTNLVLAKVDATENEIDGVEVEGFPTLKMFKKETNAIVDYKGKRDFDSIVKFIETGEQEEVEEDEEEDYDDMEDEFDDEDDKDADEEDDIEDLINETDPHDEL